MQIQFNVNYLDADTLKPTDMRIMAPNVDDAADIAYARYGHTAHSGRPRVITMAVSLVNGYGTRIIDTPVSFGEFVDHVDIWIDHFIPGMTREDFTDRDYRRDYDAGTSARAVARAVVTGA